MSYELTEKGKREFRKYLESTLCTEYAVLLPETFDLWVDDLERDDDTLRIEISSHDSRTGNPVLCIFDGDCIQLRKEIENENL